MSSKKIIFNSDSREAMKRGVDQLANAVKVTLGPKGRNVIIEKKYSTPHITKDGVSVAKEIELKDPIENMGAQLVKEVAQKTADEAGDGTTTATILAQSMITVGLKNLAAGAHPMSLKKGMESAVEAVVASLKAQTKKVDVYGPEIENVATISANNDEFIGKLITEAFRSVGKDGIVTVEESRGMDTQLKMLEGFQYDKGFLSPYFVTNTEKMEAVYENPYILIVDKKISTMKDLIPIVEEVYTKGAPLLIIADEVEGEALATLVINKVKTGLKVVAVKPPAFGDRRKATMEDIAIVTGGTYISEERGYTLEKANIQLLGRAERIIVTKDDTIIIDGKGDQDKINARVAEIRNQMKHAESDYDREKMEERLAKIAGKIAIISVGATTEVELKEKKDRIDDALHATKAAIEEGIIPGGGTGYIRAIESLNKLQYLNQDELTGSNIVKRALEEPLRQIIRNAGDDVDNGESVVINGVKSGKGDYGYNARSSTFENLYESGVIDPTKVARVALQYAASIASLFLTTECVICEEKEETKKVTQDVD